MNNCVPAVLERVHTCVGVLHRHVIRPEIVSDASAGVPVVTVKPDERGAVVFSNTVGVRRMQELYSFDGALGPQCSQEEVFTSVVEPLVMDTCAGLHTAVFCYGGVGSGKSYTMMGAVDDVKHKGTVTTSANIIAGCVYVNCTL